MVTPPSFLKNPRDTIRPVATSCNGKTWLANCILSGSRVDYRATENSKGKFGLIGYASMSVRETRGPNQDQDREYLESFLTNNPDLERLETLIADFNIFESIGMCRQEIRHSNFLAFLLDPQQNHGLGDAFVRKFLQKALEVQCDKKMPITPIELELWALDKIEVVREWENIDILLRDHANKLAVVIENKIGSQEHDNQLTRYLESVKREWGGWKIVPLFLTPNAEKPSDSAYSPLDYELVCNVLDEIAQTRAGTLNADVRMLIKHYCQMVRRHIVGDPQIKELCGQIYKKHKRALELIIESLPDQRSAVNEVLKDLIAKAEPQGLVLDDCSKTYTRFGFGEWDILRLPESLWTSTGRLLLFEFQNRGDSLRLKLILGPGPSETREKLLDIALSNQPPFKLTSRQLSEKWHTIFDLTFLTPKEYEADQESDRMEKIRDTWRSFLERDFPRIVSIIRPQAGS